MKIALLLFLISNLLSAPAQYQVYKTDSPLAIDGSLSGWSEGYFIDTIRGMENVFYDIGNHGWTSYEYNARLYMAWDSLKVYFAVLVFHDDAYIYNTLQAFACDNVMLNPGGASAKCFIGCNSRTQFFSACPFQAGLSFDVDSSFGPQGLPVYEWTLDRALLAPGALDSFRLFVGTVDNDEGGALGPLCLGFGVEYLGDRTTRAGQEDSAACYPVFHLNAAVPSAGPDTTGPVISNISVQDLFPTFARITWNTDEFSISRIIYGTDGNMDLTKQTGKLALFHEIRLMLSEATTYQYRVVSMDIFGNTDTSNLSSFNTPPLDSHAGPHVFWYKAETNQYPVTDCSGGKGPCLPANAVIHEGMIATGSVAQHSGASWPGLAIGSGADDAQGRCAFIWSKDLNQTAGSIAGAIFRAEFRDGRPEIIDGGPINIRCGVSDFQGNINTWSGVDYVPETADWQDFMNPMSSKMGFDYKTPTLEAEVIIPYYATDGRPDDFSASVLDSQFFDIDITWQVNWILSHTGDNKGAFSGQYAIVFLVPIGAGNTGKINGYAFEDGSGLTGGDQSDHPWTIDGNTAHILVYGDLGASIIENRSRMAAGSHVIGPVYPNPFNPSTSISFNLGPGRTGTLQIFDILGKLVFERPIQGSGTVIWNAAEQGSGVYVLKALSAGKTYSRKLVLQR